MAISARKRFNVLHRDGFCCRYCGRRPPIVILHVDHVVPRSKGGKDDEENLLTACLECNLGKATNLIDGTAEDGMDSFQIVSRALSHFVAATYWVWAMEPITESLRDKIVWAYCEGEGALLDHADLLPDDGYYEMVKDHREHMAKAMARLDLESKDAD